MATPHPIDSQEFSHLLKDLRVEPGDGPFAVAVSGGSDSMALALLLADFAPCHFLTFDHRLRPESGQEARQVKGWLEDRGLSHTTLKWEGKKPMTGLPAASRKARYKALEGWCREHNVRTLFLAHHLNDQAETFLMRLLKGSGIDGLTAMAPKTTGLFEPAVTLVRPLLGISKARLKETLKSRGQIWIEDPSNENRDYTRIKIRHLLAGSDDLDAETLAAMAARLSTVKSFLDDLTENLLGKSFEILPEGYGVLDLKVFLTAAPEIALRGLAKILKFISQGDYPAKRDKLERLLKSLTGKGFTGRTLSGCRLAPLPGKKVLICREARDAGEILRLDPVETAIWDNRFRVTLEKAPEPLEVRALGEKAWEKLAKSHPEVREAAIPHPARAALPAFFKGKTPVVVPHLGYSKGGFEGIATFSPKTPLSG